MSAAHIDIDAIGPAGTELGRYPTSAGERVLMGWPRGGGVEVTDRPAEGRARAYVVDRGFRCFEQLAAFVADYMKQAVRLDACPMSRRALDEIVAETDAEVNEALLAGRGPMLNVLS